MQRKDYADIEKLFTLLRSLKTEAQGKIILQFSGYEYTPDEIYEIEEIRHYVMDMFKRWPEMF